MAPAPFARRKALGPFAAEAEEAERRERRRRLLRLAERLETGISGAAAREDQPKEDRDSS